MITPYLEQLIHEGKAKYKSICFAYGTLYNIPVKKESYIIIIDFDFYGFAEFGQTPKNHITKPDSISHLIRFESQSSICDYVHRSDLIRTLIRDETFNVFGSKVINCYQVHSSDVKILVLRMPNLHDVTFNPAAMPRVANEPPNPRGTGVDAILYSAWMQPGGVDSGYYFPNGSLFPVLPLPANYKNTFGLNCNPETELLLPASPDQQTYPLFSVSYVEIAGTMPSNIKGSK